VEATSGSAYLRQNNTNGHLYLYTFYSHKIFGKNPFFTRPVSCTQSKATRRLVTRTMRKKGTDCTRIQQDVRTAHPNIRVSVRKTADKRYCTKARMQNKNIFFFSTELFKQFWGEKAMFCKAMFCRLHCASCIVQLQLGGKNVAISAAQQVIYSIVF
jgi:hypothetical protein